VKGGGSVRWMSDQDHPATSSVPPPSEIDWEFVDRLKTIGVQIKPIDGVPDLMHHKYVIRDSGGAAPVVLTGSSNWTNDSWNREENRIVTVASDETAAD